MGALFLVLGIITIFITATVTPPLISELASVFYIIAALLVGSGAFALIVKLE